jgi:GMP reductase
LDQHTRTNAKEIGIMMKILETKLDFDNVLLVPQSSNINSRSEVQLKRTFEFKTGSWTGIPIIASNMTTVSSFEMAHVLSKYGLMTALHKYYGEEELKEFYNLGLAMEDCWYSLGTNPADLEKFNIVNSHKRCIEKICIDVANGYRDSFVDYVAKIRYELPTAIIMAGNVVTPEMVRPLVEAGADIIKIGIGGGGGCLTRVKTGVGYPQFSAIVECADEAYDLGAYVCSDGGCKTPGDIAKAFAAGADFVMLGSMLAGHSECSAKNVVVDNKVYVEFYGMSSEKAMHEHIGGMENYRTSEGRHVLLPSKGPVENTILDILGGLRSTLTYVGAKTLEELPNKAVFVKVNETHNKIYENL